MIRDAPRARSRRCAGSARRCASSLVAARARRVRARTALQALPARPRARPAPGARRSCATSGPDCEAALRADPYLLAGHVPGIGFAHRRPHRARARARADDAPRARAGRDRPRAGEAAERRALVPAARGAARARRASCSVRRSTATRLERGARGAGERATVAGPRRRGARARRDGRVPALARARASAASRATWRACCAKGDARRWPIPSGSRRAERDTGIALAPRAARGRARTARRTRRAADRRPGRRQDDDRAPGRRRSPSSARRARARSPRRPGAPPSAWPRRPGGRRATLHRLLGFDPARERLRARRATTRSTCELVVVDEISMLDVALAHHLFKAVQPADARASSSAIPISCPRSAPGNVLRDLIASRPRAASSA